MKDDNQEMIQITVLMILIFIHYPLFRCFHMFFLPCFYELPKRSFCTGMAFKNCKVIQFLCVLCGYYLTILFFIKKNL